MKGKIPCQPPRGNHPLTRNARPRRPPGSPARAACPRRLPAPARKDPACMKRRPPGPPLPPTVSFGVPRMEPQGWQWIAKMEYSGS